jgi:hypothetical protein
VVAVQAEARGLPNEDPRLGVFGLRTTVPVLEVAGVAISQDGVDSKMNAREGVETTGSPAFAVNRHGVVLAWNEAARLALGHAADEGVGHHG